MLLICCQPSNDGNSSISRITFPAEVEDMGSSLSCRASNPNVPASALEDSWALNIYCELNFRIITLLFWRNLNVYLKIIYLIVDFWFCT